MINASDKILEQAKRLFNEKGYNNVSLREIAEAAGTTIGNLNYHFPKKDDLISAVQLELYTDFFNTNFETDTGQILFEEFFNSFLTMEKNRDLNVFFYRNIVELCQESSKISKNVQDFRYRIYSFFLSSFIKLQEHEFLRSDVSHEQYEILTYAMTSLTQIWRQSTTIYYDERIPRVELSKALRNLIYPYLTKKGVDLLNSLSISL